MTYLCPVCSYSGLTLPPIDFSICPSCGTEFELDDEIRTTEQLRRAWLDAGAPWFSDDVHPPAGWAEYRTQQLLQHTSNEAANLTTWFLMFDHDGPNAVVAADNQYALAA